MKTKVYSNERASFSISYAVSISSVEIFFQKIGIFCAKARAISILHFLSLETLEQTSDKVRHHSSNLKHHHGTINRDCIEHLDVQSRSRATCFPL